jgi:hypothetical protein
MIMMLVAVSVGRRNCHDVMKEVLKFESSTFDFFDHTDLCGSRT